MGCGATKQQSRRDSRDSEDDEEDFEERGSHHSNASKASNKFTQEYTSRRAHAPRSPRGGPEYSPTSKNDNFDSGFAAWQRANQQQSEEEEVEDFVFGDFKVDPNDAQQQRIERVNRYKQHTIKRKHSLREGSTRKKDDDNSVVFGDFNVKIVDEADDLENAAAVEEVEVPVGFNKLKYCTLRPLLGHTSRVKAIALAPSEMEYVSASMEDNGISLMNIRTGEETGAGFDGHTMPIIAATFSKDGRLLATSSRDNTVIVWDTMHKDGQKKIFASLEHSSLPICCTFSSDARYVVTGCQDRQCHVWDVRKESIEVSYCEHEAVVVSIACLSTAEHAITGGGDRIIRMWNIETGDDVRQFIGHDGVVISISVTPDGERFLSNDDRACKMWNVETGACILNVTLDSLTNTRLPKGVQPAMYTPPIPLSKSFLDHCKMKSDLFGMAPHGILGPQAANACKIGTQRVVFTLSCLCPGTLSRSYFAVASTNKIVYIVSCATGKEEYRFVAKASVFALAAGRKENILFGDIFGNIYAASVKGENKNIVQEKESEKKKRW